jgi:flagellar biosynthesis chaperone FliJ
MENNIISENKVKEVLLLILQEETSKIKREDFSRVQFKIDELQNSLNDTMKELRKLSDSIPSGLKTVTNGRIGSITNNLSDAQKFISQLKEKVKQHKKTLYSQQIEEKKKL